MSKVFGLLLWLFLVLYSNLSFCLLLLALLHLTHNLPTVTHFYTCILPLFFGVTFPPNDLEKKNQILDENGPFLNISHMLQVKCPPTSCESGKTRKAHLHSL